MTPNSGPSDFRNVTQEIKDWVNEYSVDSETRREIISKLIKMNLIFDQFVENHISIEAKMNLLDRMYRYLIKMLIEGTEESQIEINIDSKIEAILEKLNEIEDQI